MQAGSLRYFPRGNEVRVDAERGNEVNYERVQVCNLNPTFDKINIAKPSARILKGFTSEMYWDYCALCGR